MLLFFQKTHLQQNVSLCVYPGMREEEKNDEKKQNLLRQWIAANPRKDFVPTIYSRLYSYCILMPTTLKQNAVTVTQAGNDNAPRPEQSVCQRKMPCPPNFLVHQIIGHQQAGVKHQGDFLCTAECRQQQVEAQIAAFVQDDDISALSNKEIISKLWSDDDTAPSDTVLRTVC